MARSIRIPLAGNAGGLIRVVAVPPTSLSLSITGHRWDGHTLVVDASGPVRNLPDKTSLQVTWTVALENQSPRPVSGGSVPLKVSGEEGSLELRLDVLEARLIGKGRVTISLAPDFPPYGSTDVGGSVSFDLPCDVDLEGLRLRMAVGHRVEFVPHRHALWNECTVQVRVREVDDDDDDDRSPDDEGHGWDMIWEWGPGEKDARIWRVGCASDDPDAVWSLPDPGEQGDAELSVEVALCTDGTRAPIRERRCQVTRPRLTELRLEAHNEALSQLSWNDLDAAIRWLRNQPARKDLRFEVHAAIEGLTPGFSFAVEMTLWGRKPMPGRADLQVMEPVTLPVIGHTDAEGRVSITLVDLTALRERDQLARLLEYRFFVVLRLPLACTGTPAHMPVALGLDYDASTFAPFVDEDFAVGIPAEGKRHGKTPKDIGTGVCSSDLEGYRPLRIPHFGPLALFVRGDRLVASCRLHGELSYWEQAAPKITVTLESGQALPLETKARADEPRAMEASVVMTDARIKGQCIDARIEVTNDDATLGERCIGAPAGVETAIECVPALGPIEWVTETRGDRTIGRLVCGSRYFPTHPGASKGLRMEVFGYYEGVEGAVPLGVKLRYAIPDGKSGADGRVGASGLLEAIVDDPEDVERIEAGRTRVEVWRHYDAGKVYGMAVPRAHGEFGRGARSLPHGQIIYASKVSPQFKSRVLLVAQQLGFDPNYLMAVMAFETGEKFLPSKYASSGAVGLIQFTTAGAETVGSTKQALAKLTAEEQLLEVQRYFEYWIKAKGAVTTLEDAYMVVFCPAGIGKSAESVLYSQAADARDGTRYYARNSGLDTDGTKTITKYEAAAKVREKYYAGLADLG